MNKAITKAKEPKITRKQRLFLKLYFETGNATRSALSAYDTDDYGVAANIASENLKKLQSPIKTWMEAKGFSLQTLCSVLAEGLKATKVKTSLTEPDKVVPDFMARHKYLETASKWLKVDDGSKPEEGKLSRRVVAEEFFSD